MTTALATSKLHLLRDPRQQPPSQTRGDWKLSVALWMKEPSLEILHFLAVGNEQEKAQAGLGCGSSVEQLPSMWRAWASLREKGQPEGWEGTDSPLIVEMQTQEHVCHMAEPRPTALDRRHLSALPSLKRWILMKELCGMGLTCFEMVRQGLGTWSWWLPLCYDCLAHQEGKTGLLMGMVDSGESAEAQTSQGSQDFLDLLILLCISVLLVCMYV